MLKTKLEELASKLHKIPDEFWVNDHLWFHEREDGGDDWDAERLGFNRKGQIVWAFDSGCSCNLAWEGFDPTKCGTIEPKYFVLENFEKNSPFSSVRSGKTDPNNIEKAVDQYLILVADVIDPKQVLTIENAEIRRYMIKRIGYENIKDSVQAEVIHKDGYNELLKFENGEKYVKVKDSSTDREYLLYVEGKHKTCRSAIAWTFGLKEEEYNPIIET